MKLFSWKRERQSKTPKHPVSALLFWQTAGIKFWEWRGVLLAAPAMAGLVLALRFTGGLQLLEWAALDQFFRLRPLEPMDVRVVIVGIDEPDIQKLGKWPMSDQVMVTLLKKIKQQQPRAIGLDIFRDLAVQPGHQELVQLFETTPNLIGIETLPDRRRASGVNPPPALSQQDQVGFNNVTVDADDKLRRAWLYTEENGKTKRSLAMKLALLYLQAEGITPEAAASQPNYLQLGRGVFPRFAPDDGGYVRTDADGYQILLNFRDPARSFKTVSLEDVLEDRIPSNLMRDRVVLVGATAVSLRDFFSTPYSGAPINFGMTSPLSTPTQTSGVEVQAAIVSHLLSAALDGRLSFQVWSEAQEWAWIFLWSYVGAILSWSLRSLRWTPIAVLLIGSGLTVGCYLAFLAGWWLPLVPSLMALISSAAVLTAYVARQERADRQTVMHLFERHVTHDIAEAIWRDRKQFLKRGRLPGRRMTATVLFTDLKDFTPIAERTDPEILMAWLNEYLEAMAQIVVIHGGVIDKFIGDSIMAVFGVPVPRTSLEAIAQDAQHAVQCALDMASQLERLNDQWQQQGLPSVTMRVGISTGTVVTGSLGGLQKLDYTTVGDSVNIAARLESYDKSFEKSLHTGVCRILISEATYHYIQDKFATHFIDSEQLRGREQLTKIYQILLPEM